MEKQKTESKKIKTESHTVYKLKGNITLIFWRF